MFANLNKFICDDINVKLVHFLMVDIKQHDMIQPALTCASKVGLQTPMVRKHLSPTAFVAGMTKIRRAS